MNKKGTIIFDLDDTLFNSVELKQDIFQMISSAGIDFEVVADSYLELRKIDSIYELENHIQYLRDTTGVKISDGIKNQIQNINYKKYVSDDARNLLQELSKSYDLWLLSLGVLKVQMKKIIDTQLDNYFEQEKIIITTEPKEHKIKNLKFIEPIYFLNDKVGETEIISERYPAFSCLVFGENKKTDLPILKSILDIKNFL